MDDELLPWDPCDQTLLSQWRQGVERRRKNRGADSSICSGAETPTPPGHAAWGREGNAVKREMAQQRMTARDREVYRRGLEAGQKRLRRVRRLLRQVVRSLQP